VLTLKIKFAITPLIMRRKRLLGRSTLNYYHMMSRIVSGDFILGEEEKEFFKDTMRKLESFMGVRVLTYCLMTNHFHILLEVPEIEWLSDEEIFRRIKNFYSSSRVKEEELEYRYLKEIADESGKGEGLEEWRERFLNRMGDLSNFGKELKERFTRWYNWKTDREGTLWSARFKSVLVEDSESALSTIAAYIDLNPVRAGIVDDPKGYRFSGYGEAVSGGIRAREGVCALSQIVRRAEKRSNWSMASKFYRCHLFSKGEGRGIDSERVKEVLKTGGKLSTQELLFCRVRYFSDGMAIGSKGFVEEVFNTHREWFGVKRKTGARQIKKAEAPFFCLRDLRKEPIRAPI